MEFAIVNANSVDTGSTLFANVSFYGMLGTDMLVSFYLILACLF